MTARIRWNMIVALSAAALPMFAHAQTFPDSAPIPTPDVYAIVQANPVLLPPMPARAPGARDFTSLTVVGDSFADWGNEALVEKTSGL